MRIYEESHADWAAKPNLEGGYDILDANGWPLATLHYDYRFTSNATNYFRSNLFSAAPDLLAVCERIVDAVEDGDEMAVVDAARAAVAKVRGTKT